MLLQCVGQDLRFDVALDERVLGLERLDRGDLLDLTQLLYIEVGHTDVANEILLLELGECRPTLLDVRGRDRPVNLVEIDRVDSQPGQAIAGLAQNRVRGAPGA